MACKRLLMTSSNFAGSADAVSLSGAVGGKNFSSLAGEVSDKTLKSISEMGFTEMMEIQHRSIRPLLEGRLVGLHVGRRRSGD